MPICPNCKSEVEAGTKFCMECGADLAGENANTFTDPRDGQVYKTVKIGNQVWLAENFRYKCEGSYAYNNDNKNIKEYGRLYTWYSARECAPPGWHLPSREEWNNLQGYVEANANAEAGAALKSRTGWEQWKNVPQDSDEFGFCALPAGYRYSNGDFNNLGKYAIFWTSTMGKDCNAFYRYLRYGNEDFYENRCYTFFAFSVRLLRD